MTGYPNFNYPAFHAAAGALRKDGHFVFSPAEKDMERDGKDWGVESETGDLEEAKAKGFDRRRALHDDLSFICLDADAVYMLPGWEKSTGATAERATAIALGLEIIYG